MARRNAQHCGGKAKVHFCRRRQITSALMQLLSGNRITARKAGWIFVFVCQEATGRFGAAAMGTSFYARPWALQKNKKIFD
jgi:hypothetical protein